MKGIDKMSDTSPPTDDPDNLQLFAVYLGGYSTPGRLTEDHEVVFVVAPNARTAQKLSKMKWKGLGKAHTDAVRVLDVVDGYAVRLEPTDASETPDVDLSYEE